MPYVNDDLRRLRYNHKSGKPGIDGGQDGAATRKATEDCWVRVPVQPEHYERELPNATWSKPRAGRPAPPPANKLLRRLALCILHCAMRTGESCLTQMLLLARDKYVGNKAKDVRAINTHLNDYLWARLRLRKLVSRAWHMAGKEDPNALVNDALTRKLVSIVVLYSLAAAYEKKLQEKDAEIAKLRRRPTTAPGMQAARTPAPLMVAPWVSAPASAPMR